MYKVAFSLLSLFIAFSAFSQPGPFATGPDLNVIPDSWVNAVVHENEYAYLAGSSSTECNPTPFVSKISLTTGQTIWNTTSTITDFNYTNPRPFKKVGLVGDAIYATSEFNSYLGYPAELWKIDKTSGALVWKIELNIDYNYYDNTTVFYDYSPTQLLLINHKRYQLVNKVTGAVESFFYNEQYYYLGVAGNQTIYVYYAGGVKKIVNMDFANPVAVNNVPAGSLSIEHVNPNQILILREEDSPGKSLCLFDLTTSQVIWDVMLGIGDSYNLGDFKMKDGYAYCNFNNSFTGGPNVFNVVTKVNMNTGILAWKATKLYNSYPYSNENSWNTQGNAMSIDVNNAGDVYLTGLANAQSTSGDMGIMKLNTATGDKVYEKIITEDASDFDGSSVGVKVIIYQDKPYFIGNVIEAAGKSGNPGNLVTLVELEAATGNVVKRYNYYGNKKETSTVVQISPYLDHHILVLENRNRFMYLTRLDDNGNVVWETPVKSKYSFGHTARKFAIDQQGNVGIISESTQLDHFTSGRPPSNRDYIFVVNNTGQVIQEIQASYEGSDADIYCDGQNFFIVRTDGSFAVIYKVNTSGLVAKKEFSFDMQGTNLTTKRIGEKSGNSLFLAGYYSSLIYIDKTTLDNRDAGFEIEPSPYRVNDLLVNKDTAYMAPWDPSIGSIKSMTCHNLATNGLIWSHPGSSGYYEKFILASDGYIYAIGKGDYNGFLISKINRKTGAIMWYQSWSYDQSINAHDLYYDALRKEVIVTGEHYFDFVRSYVTVSFNALNGGQLAYYKLSDVHGTGLTIGQLGNGDIITGGTQTPTGNCFGFSKTFTFGTPIVTGIDTEKVSSAFELYPNPVSSNLQLKPLKSSNGPVIVSIVNSMGETVYTHITDISTSDDYSIDLQSYPAGQYILIIRDKNGVSLTSKVMKR